MKTPLISVCIPTFNGEKYLRECLDSCVSQTFNDFEIVICDDGSNDGTLDIVEEYRSKYTFVQLFRNEKNSGLVANWNRCIWNAKGTWIKFVFQDDYINDNCLQKFAAEIEPSTQLLVSARHFILPQNPPADYLNYYTHVVRTLENTSNHRAKFFPPDLISEIAVQNMCMNFIGEPSLTLFKKSLVEDLGFFNATLKQICDLEFFLRVSSRYGLHYIPEKLCAFRIHKDSTTNTNLENKYFELHYIEPLLFSWFLLFDKCYVDFRRHLNFVQTIKLELYFRVKCYRAYSINEKENRHHEIFSMSSEKFIEIQKYRKGNFFIRLVSRLKK